MLKIPAAPGGHRAPLSLPDAPGYHWYIVPRVGFPDPGTFGPAVAALAELHDEPWLLLTDLAPEAGNAVWYGLRSWIEQGFKVIKGFTDEMQQATGGGDSGPVADYMERFYDYYQDSYVDAWKQFADRFDEGTATLADRAQWLSVVGGLILVPLPGPGWLIVLAGLAIWSLEFTWAQRLLEFTRRQIEGWWRWVNAQHWSVRVLVGLSGLLFVGAVTWASLAVSLNVDTPIELWHRLTDP